ncbi:phosphoribosylanthranilate isomerase [Flavobacterium sp. SM2513]|uniref:phosphoribosylanthranilate isomerase n=1 Tax=Flavobacterium sp. SM2513 TaxID=3424766 RepID=UPI003D7F3AF2
MKIKICGMKFAENISQVGALQPDFLGFIFYSKSKRFVGDDFSRDLIQNLPKSIKKVGVFVNESPEIILEKVKKFDLDIVQLHGNESVSDCQFLKENNIEIMKVFSINENVDFNIMKSYELVCDYFLFDTKTPDFGGSGKMFNWQLLENYTLNKPFFLSGGLNVASIEKIKELNYPMLVGLDFNSQLEDKDFKKNISKVTEVILETRKI